MFLAKYRELKGWIPSTDVDEIDVAKEYAKEVTNVDFENGFISSASAPIKVNLPSAIIAIIASGYEILSYKYFKHSTQGDVYVCVAYKAEGTVVVTHNLKFYINGVLTSIDEISDDVTFASKPTKISYDLVNDQLKINLNINATYSYDSAFTAVSTICNLTVAYLTSRSYKNSTAYIRGAGWYITPRWLSWGLKNTDTGIIYNEAETIPGVTEFIETCNNDTFETHFNLGSVFAWSALSAPFALPSIGFYNNSTVEGKWGWVNIDSIKFLEKIKFKWGTGYLVNGYTHLKVGITNNSVTASPDSNVSWVEIWNNLYSSTVDNEVLTFEQIVNLTVQSNPKITESTFRLWIGIGLPSKDSVQAPYTTMRDIELTSIPYCVLSYNEDKQRALIKGEAEDVEEPVNRISIFDSPILKLPIVKTDWRTSKYELYLKLDLYTLYAVAEVNDGWNIVSGTYFEKSFTVNSDFPNVITTLNFNYGIGASVRVDNAKHIYREISYRNRVYFVKDDERIYYSHISGTGLAQPDSFPYSDDKQFGYLITESDEENMSLAVTSLDEVIVLTKKKSYIYTIDGIGEVVFRRIKAINGGKSIMNNNAIITEINGELATNMLVWFNEFGVYAYAGGREIPIAVTGLTHKNYWRLLSGKSSAVMIYNKAKNEVWIQIDSKVLIYEIDTNTWKKYELTVTIKDIVGVINGYTYFLDTLNDMYKIDPDGSTKLAGIIEFYDILDEEQMEIQGKVLQELYATIKLTSTELTSTIEVKIIIDDNTLTEKVYIPAHYKRYKTIAPYQVQYGRIRLRIALPALQISLREIGIAFTKLPPYNTNISIVTEVEEGGDPEL